MTRLTPYTAAGIRRVKCAVDGCKNRAAHQWQICADNRVYRPICLEHDVAINAVVMRLVWGAAREADIERYRTEVLGR